MCPRFPEPVPLKHPITSVRVALEKVRLIHLYRCKYIGSHNKFVLTDRPAPEVERSHHQASSHIGHCGFKRLCSVEWKLWQEEHK